MENKSLINKQKINILKEKIEKNNTIIENKKKNIVNIIEKEELSNYILEIMSLIIENSSLNKEIKSLIEESYLIKEEIKEIIDNNFYENTIIR